MVIAARYMACVLHDKHTNGLRVWGTFFCHDLDSSISQLVFHLDKIYAIN